MNNNVDEIVNEIRSKVDISGNYIGLILGTSFSEFVDEIADKVEVPFDKIKSFKTFGSDNKGKFIFGNINNRKVIVIVGRIHYTMGYDAYEIATPIFVLKELGCEKLIICASLGAISKKIRVGDVVTIEDHINLTARNPLYGCDYNKYGHKFVDMSDAYDNQIIDSLIDIAKKDMAIKVKKGILIEFPGPTAETPAESRYAAQLGADFIGFNLCCEVIAAKYCKLQTAVYGIITNYASAYTTNKIKHEDIVYNRQCASSYYLDLLKKFISNV